MAKRLSGLEKRREKLPNFLAIALLLFCAVTLHMLYPALLPFIYPHHTGDTASLPPSLATVGRNNYLHPSTLM